MTFKTTSLFENCCTINQARCYLKRANHCLLFFAIVFFFSPALFLFQFLSTKREAAYHLWQTLASGQRCKQFPIHNKIAAQLQRILGFQTFHGHGRVLYGRPGPVTALLSLKLGLPLFTRDKPATHKQVETRLVNCLLLVFGRCLLSFHLALPHNRRKIPTCASQYSWHWHCVLQAHVQ